MTTQLRIKLPLHQQTGVTRFIQAAPGSDEVRWEHSLQKTLYPWGFEPQATALWDSNKKKGDL